MARGRAKTVVAERSDARRGAEADAAHVGPLRAASTLVAPAVRRHTVASPRQLTLTFPAHAPDLYVHEGMRQTLERRVGALLGERVLLSITDNRRTMVSSHRRAGLLHVRLHHMFLDADEETVRALGRYLGRADRKASAALGEYIERNGVRIRSGRSRGVRLRTEGEVHDLGALYAELNREWFEGGVDVRVTWGRRGQPPRGRRRRCSIRLGTYSAEDRLIRLHPVLDQPWVPRFFVAYILFHEMLHHVVPAVVVGGRHLFHPPEFKALERRYPDYDRAIRWEKRHLHRLLGG